MQVELLPLQAPVHPPKFDFAAAASVRITWLPLAKSALHVVPQLIPAGVLLIVPAPAPAALMLS